MFTRGNKYVHKVFKLQLKLGSCNILLVPRADMSRRAGNLRHKDFDKR